MGELSKAAHLRSKIFQDFNTRFSSFISYIVQMLYTRKGNSGLWSPFLNVDTAQETTQ